MKNADFFRLRNFLWGNFGRVGATLVCREGRLAARASMAPEPGTSVPASQHPKLHALLQRQIVNTKSTVTLPQSLSSSIWIIVKGQIPQELQEELQRDFTDLELASIFANVHRTLAPSVERPKALFVFGPPAVGKSSMAHVRGIELFGGIENAVLVDGAEFRDVHGGYQAVAVHGKQHKLLHADAWAIFKDSKVPTRLKQRVFREAMHDRQHLLIPDCANDVPKVDEMLEALTNAGYELHCMCMWAPLAATRSRGEPRSLRECVARTRIITRTTTTSTRQNPS